MFFQRVNVNGIVAGKTVTKKLAYETFIEWKVEKVKEKKKIDNMINSKRFWSHNLISHMIQLIVGGHKNFQSVLQDTVAL
jgi:hypothetical protein